MDDKFLLLSIDLEDIGLRSTKYISGVNHDFIGNTDKIIQFLDTHGLRCTFYIVGDVIRKYPQVVEKIKNCGHEIACHTNTHVSIHGSTPEALSKELDAFLEATLKVGLGSVKGFRAPFFSVTKSSTWIYKLLYDRGFLYSSSVYPGKHFFIWLEGFWKNAKKNQWSLGISNFNFSVFRT